MSKKSHTLFFFMLVIVYTLTNIGVPVYYHYCGGELEKVSALVKTQSCCGSEEDEGSDDGCCKNEVKHASFHAEFSTAPKLDPDFSPSFASLFFQLPSALRFNEASVPSFIRFHYDYHPPNTSGPESVETTVFRI